METTKTCNHCKKAFEITDADRALLNKFQVPEPQNCPDCRMIRRFLERNAKHLYYRKCDLTGEKTLSQYHQDQPFPVYSPSAWWSDKFNAIDYGQEFDFNKPFFTQFQELKNKTPHLALFNTKGTLQNSTFNNCTAYLKNCYLIAESDFCEDCYYSNLLKKCTNLVDCSVCYESELCHECADCTKCYGLKYSKDCENCKDSFALENCISCADCIGCINQRHKQYMIFNKQLSKEEYEFTKNIFQLHTASGIETFKNKCRDFFLSCPRKAVFAEHNENSTGDHLFDSKNAFYCFDSRDLEDCRYCAKLTLGVKTSMDYNSWGNKSELMYQCAGTGDHCYNLRFCVMCQTDMRNCDYCYECFSCNDCFGCIGLKKEQYCILNKQYDKPSFDKLKMTIIEHMKKDETFGEFFPIPISAFGYNESIAQDIYPLDKEEALSRGYKWRDEELPQATPQTYDVPDDINNLENTILGTTLLCVCGKNYKIIPQELRFYKQLSIPIPRQCPSCRHSIRMLRRNPPGLWQKTCAKCEIELLSSYAPDRPEIVYCEQCYLKVVY